MNFSETSRFERIVFEPPKNFSAGDPSLHKKFGDFRGCFERGFSSNEMSKDLGGFFRHVRSHFQRMCLLWRC